MKIKKRMIGLAATALMMVALSAVFLPVWFGEAKAETSDFRYEGPGFGAPQVAVAAYIEARNAADLYGMLSTFAVETYVDRLDEREYLLQTRSASSFAWRSIPDSSPLLRQMKIGSRVGELIDDWYQQTLYYAWPGENYGAMVTPISFTGENGDAEIDTFLASFISPMLGSMKLKRFVDPYEFDVNMAQGYERSRNNLKFVQREFRRYGFDEKMELIAEIQVGKSTGYLFMRCARYGDKWYNFENRSFQSVGYNMSPYASGLLLPENMN